MTPRGLLIAAIVDAINIYQGDPTFRRHIKDEKQFDLSGQAKGELWNKKYDAAEAIADRWMDEICRSAKASPGC
jgi:hypothetical protein